MLILKRISDKVNGFFSSSPYTISGTLFRERDPMVDPMEQKVYAVDNGFPGQSSCI
jgi:hypothetical protein